MLLSFIIFWLVDKSFQKIFFLGYLYQWLQISGFFLANSFTRLQLIGVNQSNPSQIKSFECRSLNHIRWVIHPFTPTFIHSSPAHFGQFCAQLLSIFSHQFDQNSCPHLLHSAFLTAAHESRNSHCQCPRTIEIFHESVIFIQLSHDIS